MQNINLIFPFGTIVYDATGGTPSNIFITHVKIPIKNDLVTFVFYSQNFDGNYLLQSVSVTESKDIKKTED